MSRHYRVRVPVVVCLALLSLVPSSVVAGQEPGVERIDYLTFAQGAFPVRVGGAGAAKGATIEDAIGITDGDPRGFTIVSRATDETDTEFVYELPAATTFDRFAVPNVLETPSPSQTFMRRVEVHGSATGPDDGYVLLAEGELTTHPSKGQVTELEVVATRPVRWVRVRLVGGIRIERPESFLEFSEIIGNGVQETPALIERFSGTWRGSGVRLRLRQEGAVVSGCYDTGGVLAGTVTGNVLRATGTAQSTKVPSLFILGVDDEGAIRGLRSTNGAPFRTYAAPAAEESAGPPCPGEPEPAIGCGSVIHGIRFGFDSAEILAESTPVLEALYRSLAADASGSILVEGHTSSEGAEAYNQALSERRARAVVEDLLARGIAAGRLRAAGVGETRPIATNDDESGRSLNRRVEIHCTEGG